MKYPEQYRLYYLPSHPNHSKVGEGGMFSISHPKNAKIKFNIKATDGLGWEHVSVTVAYKTGLPIKRTPTWSEMNFVKDIFWDNTQTVIQIHPPKTEYVNNHPYCLHLWRKIGFEQPLPDAMMVGLPGFTFSMPTKKRKKKKSDQDKGWFPPCLCVLTRLV